MIQDVNALIMPVAHFFVIYRSHSEDINKADKNGTYYENCKAE